LEQPTPTVTGADVERVVRRDFPPDQFESVMSVLAEYGGETWHREMHRVHLAILKLAAGRLDALRGEVETAKCDYRDILAYAEYPRYSREIGFGDVPALLKRDVIEDDWRQYESWLTR
jgi:hypothetical protein